jgi:hypothetical protein
MKDRVVCRIGVVLAAAACVTLPSVTASAQGEGAAREATSSNLSTPNEAAESKHEPLYLGLDFMLGFGTYTAALTQNPIPPDINPHSVQATTSFRTTTFTLQAHYDFKKFGIGVRLPLVSGHIDSQPLPAAIESQDVFTSGNLEISFDMPRKLNEHVKYIPELALTLPTSPGSTPPYTEEQLAASQPDGTLQDQYNRYAVGLAAAFARGGEDDALFFNWRLGLTPKVGFDLKFDHTHILPYAKLPILFGLEQSPGAEEPVRIEAVGGLGIMQDIGPVHLGLRAVAMIPIAARTSLKTPMLSIWPEVRLQITPSAQFWVAGMIPVAGDYNIFYGPYDGGKYGGFNAGLAATF